MFRRTTNIYMYMYIFELLFYIFFIYFIIVI